MIAGPEVARIIQEFKETSSEEVIEEKRHNYEETLGLQVAFNKWGIRVRRTTQIFLS